MQVTFVSIAVILISLCATFILLYVLNPQPQTQPVTQKEVPTVVKNDIPLVTFSAPVKLKIDTINVSGIIKPVGLTSDGDMAIDENPDEAAWYKFGPKPGEVGSSVVAGHYGWKNGAPSIFNDLSKLAKGDKVVAIGEDGREVTFAVTHSAVYSPDQDATDVFRSNDGKAHLNLITCQGSWNNTLSTYSERLIVFTDLVDEGLI